MATYSELLKELNRLPLGDVYQKTINGKQYFYHQYFHAGKRYSVLVKGEELESLRLGIARRKEVERQLKDYRPKDVTLSKNANELTGCVMNGDRVVARFEKGALVDIDEKHCPLVIRRTHSIEKFLKLRVLDMSRTNARILKKVLHIDVDEDYKASLYSYALSVSDHYWFKPKHSKLTYQDVEFDNDALFDTSLKGEVNVFYHKAKLSPELTTTGSFEKGWRYIDRQWWLYKSGNDKQFFSELFCSRFAELIGIPTVKYELDHGYIRCLNFSPVYNFEPMAAIADDNEDYDYLFNLLYAMDPKLAKEYLKLIFFDTAVNNIDRHNENLGLLRDYRSGRIVSLAPNFDNNLALIATTDSLNANLKKDGFVEVFVRFLKKNEVAMECFKELDLKDISIYEIQGIVDSISVNTVNTNGLAEGVLERYNYLKSFF